MGQTRPRPGAGIAQTRATYGETGDIIIKKGDEWVMSMASKVFSSGPIAEKGFE